MKESWEEEISENISEKFPEGIPGGILGGIFDEMIRNIPEGNPKEFPERVEGLIREITDVILDKNPRESYKQILGEMHEEIS